MKCLALALLMLLTACHVTPLPVPDRHAWNEDPTDYPPLNTGRPLADAGADR